MCNFFKEDGQCSISMTNCPFVYFCTKTNTWKMLKYSKCKIKESQKIPNGYYKVCFERHGNLYIEVDNKIEIVKNPFKEIPLFVKIFKLKSGKIKLKAWEG